MNGPATTTEPVEPPRAILQAFLTRHGLWPAGADRRGASAGEPGCIAPLAGGANNAVFRVDVPAGTFLLKQYFTHPADDRDRFAAETAFCCFAREHGIGAAPQLLASCAEQRLALFEFIAGRVVSAAEIDDGLIGQTVRFCRQLQDAQGAPAAEALPAAAESCFSIRQHLACVDRRIRRLQALDAESELQRDVRRFACEELAPCWEATQEQVLVQCRALGIAPQEELGAADRVLSPSDFGFHNALLDRRGQLRFFDFEYAGWDDPAKLVCDFFCQVEVPVPLALFPLFCHGIVSRLPEPERVRQRIDALFPVYRVKWCCIVLNEFLPLGQARRRFSAANQRPARQPELQFRKAQRLLNELRERPSATTAERPEERPEERREERREVRR
ncbi:MAG: aminoglycoside phosphotransferase family protein [Candidatus Anammoximicrobium sp.]|nr:aminoglycoside phosphotransferase family protein [Candidatus Anammoximicrobium sp.]